MIKQKIQTKENCSSLNNLKMILLAVFLIIACVYVVLLARNAYKNYDYIGKTAESKNEITISGEAEVIAVPDIAKVQISMFTEKQTVAEAQNENSKRMNDLIAAIKDLKIEEKDIKTTSYYITPEYDWTDEGRIFKGYRVSQEIEIKIRKTDVISQVLAVAGNKGADNIGSLSFEIDDLEAVKQQARIKAIENAKDKAEELAKAMDVKLGSITNFSENSYAPLSKYDYTIEEVMSSYAGEREVAPEIPVGENQIQANVTITFELL